MEIIQESSKPLLPESPISLKNEPRSPPDDLLQQEQQQYAADSASPSAGSKTFVPCKVCGDKASGYHYGVTSCEGCKGFFRRSIQKQIEYRCLRDGECLVIRLNRNRCQYCRFRKCLAVGMSRDSVRYGRVPKRSRERGPDEASRDGMTNTVSNSVTGSVPSSNVSITPCSTISEEAGEIARAVGAAHRAHCAFSEALTRGLERRPVDSPSPVPSSPIASASSSSDSVEVQRIWLWQQLAIKVTPSVQRIVEFAKRVPGFPDLSQDDQLILIKMGFFEVWLSNAARLATDSTLSFDDGVYVTHQQLEIMYDSGFASSLLRFTSNLNALCLNETELGLFSAAVLVTADRSGATDIKAIQHTQDMIIDALKQHASCNQQSGGSGLGATIAALLGELRAVGARHALLLDWFRVNWMKLRLPPLFAEILDIPKCNEDLQRS